MIFPSLEKEMNERCPSWWDEEEPQGCDKVPQHRQVCFSSCDKTPRPKHHWGVRAGAPHRNLLAPPWLAHLAFSYTPELATAQSGLGPLTPIRKMPHRLPTGQLDGHISQLRFHLPSAPTQNHPAHLAKWKSEPTVATMRVSI